VTVFLVRHAQAGSRKAFEGNDRARRLTGEGRHQAADIAGLLVDLGATRTLTSPYRRCIETIAPAAAALGLAYEVDERLAEGPADGAIELVRSLSRSGAAICSHGDIIPAILEVVDREDAVVLGRDPRCQKGSIWILEPDPGLPGRFAGATYLPAR
jgi:broad specificity phosphatase PhoE